MPRKAPKSSLHFQFLDSVEDPTSVSGGGVHRFISRTTASLSETKLISISFRSPMEESKSPLFHPLRRFRFLVHFFREINDRSTESGVYGQVPISASHSSTHYSVLSFVSPSPLACELQHNPSSSARLQMDSLVAQRDSSVRAEAAFILVAANRGGMYKVQILCATYR